MTSVSKNRTELFTLPTLEPSTLGALAMGAPRAVDMATEGVSRRYIRAKPILRSR